MPNITYINLSKLHPPKFDHRITPNQEADDELRDSIRELGILEPLLVKKIKKGFELIAGNRRFTQATRAGLASVPCIVLSGNDAALQKIMIHENTKRTDLSHIDQAYTFAHLIKEFNLTETQVATLIGKSVGYVCQHLALLSADDTLIQLVSDNTINFSVARELLSCQDENERKRLTDIAAENGASVTIVHDWVKESNRETEKLTSTESSHTSSSDIPTPSTPLYPCGICTNPIPIPEIRVVHLCKGCHYTFFHEIELEKFRIRTEKAPPS